MSSSHDHHVKEAEDGSDQPSVRQPGQDIPEPEKGPIPPWLIGLIGFGIFWAGAYLFSFSGGFRGGGVDFLPKLGGPGGGAEGGPDAAGVGKALFLANWVDRHPRAGAGVPGHEPRLHGTA